MIVIEKMMVVMIISRVAELGSLSSRAKMAIKIFVKRVFTILATNTSFLRITATLQIVSNNSALLPQETLF